MLPDNKVWRVDKWLEDLNAPRDRKYPNTRSFCTGGVGVGDTSEGILGYTWQAWTDGAAVYLQRIDQGRPQTILTDKGITDVSVAFDRQMNLVIAYQAGVESKLWVGRNGSATGSVVLAIKGGKTPKVALDDNRYATAGTSDVVFAYINNSKLYCRYQREKYQVEHQLMRLDETTTLYQMGMGKDNRFLFLLKKEVTK